MRAVVRMRVVHTPQGVRYCGSRLEEGVRVVVGGLQAREIGYAVAVDMRSRNVGGALRDGLRELLAFVEEAALRNEQREAQDLRWFIRDEQGQCGELSVVRTNGVLHASVRSIAYGLDGVIERLHRIGATDEAIVRVCEAVQHSDLPLTNTAEQAPKAPLKRRA